MKTKSGLEIPPLLSKMLDNDASLRQAWDTLRPSCQHVYVDRLNSAKPEARKKNLERVLLLTREYAQRHPEKYSKSK